MILGDVPRVVRERLEELTSPAPLPSSPMVRRIRASGGIGPVRVTSVMKHILTKGAIDTPVFIAHNDLLETAVGWALIINDGPMSGPTWPLPAVSVFVDPKYRRHGIGSRLVEAALEHARDMLRLHIVMGEDAVAVRGFGKALPGSVVLREDEEEELWGSIVSPEL